MVYSEAIKTLRKKLILSQTEFAKLLGVSYATVNRWESGHFDPTIKSKRKLAPYFKKYKIEVDDQVPLFRNLYILEMRGDGNGKSFQ